MKQTDLHVSIHLRDGGQLQATNYLQTVKCARLINGLLLEKCVTEVEVRQCRAVQPKTDKGRGPNRMEPGRNFHFKVVLLRVSFSFLFYYQSTSFTFQHLQPTPTVILLFFLIKQSLCCHFLCLIMATCKVVELLCIVVTAALVS